MIRHAVSALCLVFAPRHAVGQRSSITGHVCASPEKQIQSADGGALVVAIPTIKGQAFPTAEVD